jgi:hypothetical protein
MANINGIAGRDRLIGAFKLFLEKCGQMVKKVPLQQNRLNLLAQIK